MIETRRFLWVLAATLVVGFGVRAAHWPSMHDVRDGDELAYTWGSLQLLEGNLPGIHYSPAGPQTWVGWAFEAAISMKQLVYGRPAALQVRPFLAVDDAVFNAYRDGGLLREVWIITSVVVTLAGTAAASRLGYVKSGLAGAAFLGGAAAILPLFVDFSVQARPYATAWSFGMMALYYATASKRLHAAALSAVCMGLAIGSRIDMAILFPIVWSEFWNDAPSEGRWRKLILYHAIAAGTFLIVAPWYVPTLVASLRAIASVRGSTVGFAVLTKSEILRQLLWSEGLIVYVLLFVFGVTLCVRSKPRKWVLALYLLLLGASFFKGAAFGLRYQGAQLIIILFIATTALQWLHRRSAGLAAVAASLALVAPSVETFSLIAKTKRGRAPDEAVSWVEAHISPGAIVYVRPWITNLLPTAEASDASWHEVADGAAYRKKFRQGMERFHLASDEEPRALSDVNLALERGIRRFMFILGGHPSLPIPRFDVRVFDTGPVFGVRPIDRAFRETGGVVILRGPLNDPACEALGIPTVAWLNPEGDGTRIYCSSDTQLRAQ
ncbi:MAG: hypothetical protein ABR589_08555 [Chthoniobacterales bacterium]